MMTKAKEGKYRVGDLVQYKSQMIKQVDVGFVAEIGEYKGERWATIYWADEPTKSYTIWEASSYWWNIEIVVSGIDDD